MTSTTRRAMVIAPLACAFAPLMTPLVHAAAGMEVGGVQLAAAQQVQQHAAAQRRGRALQGGVQGSTPLRSTSKKPRRRPPKCSRRTRPSA